MQAARLAEKEKVRTPQDGPVELKGGFRFGRASRKGVLMAGGASEPLRPAQPALAPPGSEAGRRPAPRRRRALRLAASLGLLLSTAGVVGGWWVWNVFQVRTTNAYVVGNITPVSSEV